MLPDIKGTYRPNADLSKSTWFGVGGPAEILFKPKDKEDLATFLKHKPKDTPVMVIGVGSNLLVRDGGIKGVVIRLGRGFTDVAVNGHELTAGAGTLDLNTALFAQKKGLGGLEFLSGIPGTIGGAIRMNAGAYGTEVKDVLVSAEVVTAAGEIKTLSAADLGFSYRKSRLTSEIVVAATFKGILEDPAVIAQRITKIRTEREDAQPTRAKTGGSTFKNPDGQKAWKLINAVDGRGLKIGGAQVSTKHCNFLINTGNATATDLEQLGEELRRRVKESSGIELEWEIKRVGIS